MTVDLKQRTPGETLVYLQGHLAGIRASIQYLDLAGNEKVAARKLEASSLLRAVTLAIGLNDGALTPGERTDVFPESSG